MRLHVSSWGIATSESPLTPVAENVLDRAFAPERPDRVWTADVTHVATGEGWLYLAVVGQ